eukprot:CAMPEP_0184390000 /NCGR_PEP_ID=MMETSP0007-20130409/12973_1 /TAXON_ID=97485 /ORGANISM="Prymnesium parvum, Strain Texoma1" /LENGTH=86 /DNA_ID=CAMNT_0026739575 /DNA_START=67 /DNA_END=325 /DNA_ORIENTATION=-
MSTAQVTMSDYVDGGGGGGGWRHLTEPVKPMGPTPRESIGDTLTAEPGLNSGSTFAEEGTIVKEELFAIVLVVGGALTREKMHHAG